MSKLDEKTIIDSISKIKTETERIKGLNERLIRSLNLENVLKRLNKEYLKDEGSIEKSESQIYVKTFDKKRPLIVDFIYLYDYHTYFFISVLNGTHIYVASFKVNFKINKNIVPDILEKDLNSKKLIERENLVYFEQNEMIGSYNNTKGINEVNLEEINTRIARVFFETFLNGEALE